MDVKKTQDILLVTATANGNITVLAHPSTTILEYKPPQFIEDVTVDLLVRFGGENLILFTGPFKQPWVIFYDFYKKQIVRSFSLEVIFGSLIFGLTHK